MDNIKNKTALVTGGASGIGYQYVHKLLKNGAKVVALIDLSTSPGQTSVANLEKEFGKGKAVFYPCDVTDTEKFKETFKKIWNAFNGLDIVINNAGMLKDPQWSQTINLNVLSLIEGSLLAMDYMGKHKGGKGGTIVNIASIVALTFFPILPVYCASKHCVLAFSRCLQENYNKTGVRVLVMCPGVTDTPLVQNVEKKVLNFIEPADVEAVFSSLPSQPTEHVAQDMMTLIQKGKNGAVWISEGNKPPCAVEFPPIKKVSIDA